MRASIVAANAALLVVGVAAAQSDSRVRLPTDSAATAPLLPPACRAAAWPYVPVDCVGEARARQVRVVRAANGQGSVR